MIDEESEEDKEDITLLDEEEMDMTPAKKVCHFTCQYNYCVYLSLEI